MRNYTEITDSLLEQYPTEDAPLTKQEQQRIYDLAMQ